MKSIHPLCEETFLHQTVGMHCLHYTEALRAKYNYHKNYLPTLGLLSLDLVFLQVVNKRLCAFQNVDSCFRRVFLNTQSFYKDSNLRGETVTLMVLLMSPTYRN